MEVTEEINTWVLSWRSKTGSPKTGVI